MAIQASSTEQQAWQGVETEAPTQGILVRYGFAVLTAIVGLILRAMLSPLLGSHNAYHTAWAAVVFAAWYCGVGPAIVTTLLSLVGVWYWFLPAGRSFLLSDMKIEFGGMIGFLVLSGFIIALGEANRRSKNKSEIEIRERAQTEQRLRARERDLEALHAALADRVQERTAELHAAVKGLRQLSARLLQAQDDERRRLARELHDSVGQLLAAISMNFDRLRATPLSPDVTEVLEENSRLVEQISSEIRTMSHLLHPPLLDEMGLASALRWYIDGFSSRSKIATNLEIAGDFGRLSNEMEIAIFRMVQECLTNVHRYSESPTAEVRIEHTDGQVRVHVSDAGKGIPLEKQPALSSSHQSGVGFRGMRERIQELGGSLEIASDEHGTIVRATMPMQTLAPVSANRNAA